MVGERFITTLKGKNIEKNDIAYHIFLGKTPVDTDYPHLTEDIETNRKAHKFKVGNEARMTKYKKFFATVTPIVSQKKYL